MGQARQRRSAPSPLSAETNGDFSALLALGTQYQIYDPATTQAAANGRLHPHAVPRQHHPGESTRSRRQSHRSLLPAAEHARAPRPGRITTRAYFKDTFDYNVHVVRVDQNWSDKNRAFVRLNHDRYYETDAPFSGNIAGGLDLTRINRGGVIDDVMVLSPRPFSTCATASPRKRRPRTAPAAAWTSQTLGFSHESALAAQSRDPDLPAGLPEHQGAHQPLHRRLHRNLLRVRELQYRRRHTHRHRPRLGGHRHYPARKTLPSHYGVDLRLYRTFGFAGGFDVSPQLTFTAARTPTARTTTRRLPRSGRSTHPFCSASPAAR